MAGAGTAILKSSVMNKKSKKKSANGGLDAVYLRQANANPRYWRGADRLKDGAGSRCSGSRSPDRNPASLRRQQKKGERAMRSPFPSNERSQLDL
jgi:hypothetical protein